MAENTPKGGSEKEKKMEAQLEKKASQVAAGTGQPLKRGRDRIPIGAGLWLLWVGFGASATLSSLGYHWLIAQSVSLVFYVIWGVYNVDLSAVARRFLFAFVEIFFRDFDVAGLTNVPKEGPVIFACAPHNNQFVDGLCVLKGIPSRTDIGFLVASSSMRKKVIGDLARALNSIPVERPQDLAKPGTGTVKLFPGTNKVVGDGTKFLTELTKKCLITISKGPHKGLKVKVGQVLSDTEATLLKPLDIKEPSGEGKKGENAQRPPDTSPIIASFKVIPHLDQSHVFRHVTKRLGKGGAVGIFPEGGSHDRTTLLPLKVGITIMALGAMEAHKGLKVKILPVGINYFKGHRFRSRVFIDIGAPIIPTDDMLSDYIQGGDKKRNACNTLLKTIMAGIKAVTLEAPDYDTLQFFRTMRRLYWTGDRRMTATERFALTSAFAKGYPAVKDKPQVKELCKKVTEYRTTLKDFAISDFRVSIVEKTGEDRDEIMGENVVLGLIAYRALLLLVYFLAAIPGSIAAAPYFIFSNIISARKAREAAAKSSVKIYGKDLLATWKILIAMVLVPSLHSIYTLLFWLFKGEVAAIVYFFFMPFVSLLTVLSYEMGMKLWNSLRPLIISLFRKNTGLKIVALRRQTREMVMKVIKEFNWDAALMNDKEMKHLFVKRFSTLDMDEDEDDELETCMG
mmetsp:Transcript_22237/g.31056  ORF Transcript_22237/g.31056 Transcript_22237/m.31056 type:complete len:681 (-) Transcript_22237:397-2439(-)|eukprot:CAMPEP_0184479288 /NCGR_PEP_ID=MMETSP0113_2-20130426/1072_1 /TAXON_ID=91329 /ORGANISM="Norrisiella sphaerica, Strain BC52" /LENGTH=680 /DNA_ID=CAMNT_0026857341 /DNA_START=103 /DNA_END=2145 /DNA_ORIENTATION=+